MMRRTVKNHFFFRPKSEFYLTVDAQYNGQVDDVDSVHIHGRIEGNIHCRETLYVSRGAEVSGDVFAGSAVIEGNVHGDVRAERWVTLCPGARLLGNLRARRVDFADGSFFHGRIEMPRDFGRELKRSFFLFAMGLRQWLASPPYTTRRLSLLLAGLAVALYSFSLLRFEGQAPAPVVPVEAVVQPAAPARPVEVIPTRVDDGIPTPGPIVPKDVQGGGGIPEDRETKISVQPAPLPAGAVPQPQGTSAQNPPAVAAPSDQNIKDFLERWRVTWQESVGVAGKMNAYFSFYSNNFSPETGSRSSWRQEKLCNTKGKTWIRIVISHVSIVRKDLAAGRVEVRFRQQYRSPNFTDVTMKRLLLEVSGARLRILREEDVYARK